MTHDVAAQVRETVDAVYRSESRRVLATLIRLLGDFDLAEEALHEAFASAVEQWSRDGVPANPRAWLVSTGRFKAIDTLRRRARHDASLLALAERLDADLRRSAGPEMVAVEDDRLRLIFTCCHPALPPEAQICAHVARSLRTDDGGNRQCLSHRSVHAGPADRAGEGQNSCREDSLSNPVARESCPTGWGRCCM